MRLGKKNKSTHNLQEHEIGSDCGLNQRKPSGRKINILGTTALNTYLEGVGCKGVDLPVGRRLTQVWQSGIPRKKKWGCLQT